MGSSDLVDGAFRAWMRAAQAGDAAAYETLLRELVPLLRAFVARVVRDRDAEEDVVQQVLLQLHRARHTYRPERPFGPWLRTIARNAARDFFRARARRAARERAVTEADADRVAVEAPREVSALGPELARALAELPPGQREALELLYLEELGIAEAARRVGASPGAVKLRAHRGLAALRDRFGRRRP